MLITFDHSAPAKANVNVEDGRTRFFARFSHDNPGTLALHPETAEAFEIVAGKVSHIEYHEWGGRWWAEGEIVPGVRVTVFGPVGMETPNG